MTNKIKAYGICVYRRVNDTYEVLLCKSVSSVDKWGFLKGVSLTNENKEDTALREFEEESSLKINKKYFEEFFIQENELKDIGIYLYNAKNIKDIEQFFISNSLMDIYVCEENSKVKFFSIKKLPKIKSKQVLIVKSILEHLMHKA